MDVGLRRRWICCWSCRSWRALLQRTLAQVSFQVAPTLTVHLGSAPREVGPEANRMNSRRVAVFRSELLPLSETFIRDQVKALHEWQPILIGLREVAGGLETPGVDREVIDIRGNRIVSAYLHWFARPIPVLVERLKALQLRLVHAHFGPDATDIWPSVEAAGLPMLVTLHGYDINTHREWWEAGGGGARRRVYPRRLLRMARNTRVHFIAVSQAIKARAVEYGIPEGKITVSHIGVDTERFKPGGLPLDRRRRRILFAGRMVEKKAPLLMVRAFAEVRKELPDAQLVMIGDGPLLLQAKKLAHELSVPVEFLGACSSDQVLVQMHQASVFCLPSVKAASGDAEGLPISILEAMACGVPVVTSSMGASEVIDSGASGIIHNEYDVEMMSKMILTVMKDVISARYMAGNALAKIHKFDIQINSERLQHVYGKIANS